VPLGPYIADFACLSARLIVELDGTQHAESAHDKLRDRWFHDDDFRVLRIWNGDLIRNRPGVLDAIWFALQRPSPATDTSVGTPSPLAGEGGAQRRMRGYPQSPGPEFIPSPASLREAPSPARGEGVPTAEDGDG
jgi:hypothetical protein